MDFGMPTLLELCDLRENAAFCAELGLRFVEINMNFPHHGGGVQPLRFLPRFARPTYCLEGLRLQRNAVAALCQKRKP